MAYSDKEKTKIVDKICELIVDGKSLRSALKTVKVSAETFFIWIREDEIKSKQYAQSTIERAELMFEDMFDIADSEPKIMDSKFGRCVDTGDIQHKRVRIDTRKWALSKMMPKKYGLNPQDDTKEDAEVVEVVDFSYKELTDANK